MVTFAFGKSDHARGEAGSNADEASALDPADEVTALVSADEASVLCTADEVTALVPAEGQTVNTKFKNKKEMIDG